MRKVCAKWEIDKIKCKSFVQSKKSTKWNELVVRKGKKKKNLTSSAQVKIYKMQSKMQGVCAKKEKLNKKMQYVKWVYSIKRNARVVCKLTKKKN